MLGAGVDKLQSLRGMVDLLPEQTAIWQQVEAAARSQFHRAGLAEIRTPLLEATELFARGIGTSTDVVGKEMYSFEDRGQRHCTLRPEGTASVVRAALQHGLLNKGPQRLWYTGPMFRYERPQAGRQRQFHQLGVELLGFADPRSDAEAIAIAWDLLTALGIGNLALEINSLGDACDRSHYRSVLVEWLEARRDQLDPEAQGRISTNPLRILDSKNPETQALLAAAPLLGDCLSASSQQRFERVRQALDRLEIPYQLNPRLVRGLDYYTHTAFEITSSELGAQATVCGGGRYDGLIEQLGGSPTAAIGWAIGLERLVLLLQAAVAPAMHPLAAAQVYVISRGEAAELQALALARTLRQAGCRVELDLTAAAFAKQLKRADRSGASWALLIGEGEIEQGVVILKDLRLSTEQRLPPELAIGELVARFCDAGPQPFSSPTA
ncbi:histidyl-tRNA synthetase [Synechococcus sp. Ace-Pa]|nr:histidyl-tRNA synthetase [Synechococcus sp. Ace-Pa]